MARLRRPPARPRRWSRIGIAIFLSGLLAVLFTRIRLPALAGFIIAGIVAGPLGFGLVTDVGNIDTIAQLGFVLLLFMIGLEIDLTKIAAAGKTIIITGIVQFPLTILFGFGVAKLLLLFGLGTDLMPNNLTALYLGAVIAGSSTLLVIKLYQDAFELDTAPGRIALGMLVFQDIWATVIILLQPRLASPELLPILGSFAGIIILSGLAIPDFAHGSQHRLRLGRQGAGSRPDGGDRLVFRAGVCRRES